MSPPGSGMARIRPIDANSIQQVLGMPMIQNLAAKYGVDTNQVSTLLAQHLPGIIDHLTPNGQALTPT